MTVERLNTHTSSRRCELWVYTWTFIVQLAPWSYWEAFRGYVRCVVAPWGGSWPGPEASFSLLLAHGTASQHPVSWSGGRKCPPLSLTTGPTLPSHWPWHALLLSPHCLRSNKPGQLQQTLACYSCSSRFRPLGLLGRWVCRGGSGVLKDPFPLGRGSKRGKS